MDENGYGLTHREACCLKQKDEGFFSHGACHILAVALSKDARWAPCELVRVEVSGLPREKDTAGAYHVYTRKNDEILDAKGKRPEAAYLCWLKHHLEAKRGSAVIRGIKPVSKEELLAKHHRDPACGARMNQWGLFTGDRFVFEATQRAEKALERWSGQGALR